MRRMSNLETSPRHQIAYDGDHYSNYWSTNIVSGGKNIEKD